MASWIVLRGRCRTCHQPISVRYPLVELTTGIGFALVTWAWHGTLVSAAYCFLAATMIAIGLIEYGGGVRPCRWRPSAPAAALVIIVVAAGWHDHWRIVVGSLIGTLSPSPSSPSSGPPTRSASIRAVTAGRHPGRRMLGGRAGSRRAVIGVAAGSWPTSSAWWAHGGCQAADRRTAPAPTPTDCPPGLRRAAGLCVAAAWRCPSSWAGDDPTMDHEHRRTARS